MHTCIQTLTHTHISDVGSGCRRIHTCTHTRKPAEAVSANKQSMHIHTHIYIFFFLLYIRTYMHVHTHIHEGRRERRIVYTHTQTHIRTCTYTAVFVGVCVGGLVSVSVSMSVSVSVSTTLPYESETRPLHFRSQPVPGRPSHYTTAAAWHNRPQKHAGHGAPSAPLASRHRCHCLHRHHLESLMLTPFSRRADNRLHRARYCACCTSVRITLSLTRILTTASMAILSTRSRNCWRRNVIFRCCGLSALPRALATASTTLRQV